MARKGGFAALDWDFVRTDFTFFLTPAGAPMPPYGNHPLPPPALWSTLLLMGVALVDESPPEVASFTLSTGDRLTLFSAYRAWIAQLVADLDRARREIVMEMYAFEPEGEGGLVADALLAAAARGVRVRIIVDGLGCHRVPAVFFDWLRDNGIELRVYHPVRWWSALLHPGRPLRRRNHR